MPDLITAPILTESEFAEVLAALAVPDPTDDTLAVTRRGTRDIMQQLIVTYARMLAVVEALDADQQTEFLQAILGAAATTTYTLDITDVEQTPLSWGSSQAARGIAFNPNTNEVGVVVRDTGTLFRFALDGTLNGQFNLASANDEPIGVTFDTVNRKWLVLNEQGPVYRYSEVGTLETFYAIPETSVPEGITFEESAEELYIVDRSFNVRIYNISGVYQRSWSLRAADTTPRAITAIPITEEIIVESNTQFSRYQRDGTFIDSAQPPAANDNSQGITFNSTNNRLLALEAPQGPLFSYGYSSVSTTTSVAEAIRNLIQTLMGENRLDASAVKGIQNSSVNADNVLEAIEAFSPGQESDARDALGVDTDYVPVLLSGTFDLSSGNNNPSGMTDVTSEDEIWIPQSSTQLIYRYTPTATGLTFLGVYNLNSQQSFVLGAAYIPGQNEVWLGDSVGDRFYRYSAIDGSTLGSYLAATANSNTESMAYIPGTNEVWVLDNNDNVIYRYNTSGGSLGTHALIAGNTGSYKGIVYIPLLDEVWVADDTDTDGFYRYSITGTYLGFHAVSGLGRTEGLVYRPELREIWQTYNDDEIKRFHLEPTNLINVHDIPNELTNFADNDRIPMSDESEPGSPTQYAQFSNLVGFILDLHNRIGTELTTFTDDDRMPIVDADTAGDPTRFATLENLKAFLGPNVTNVSNVFNTFTNTEQAEIREAIQVAQAETTFASLGTYSLGAGNSGPQGITHISTIDEIWVVDTDDNIYRYSTAGAFLGTYSLDSGNTLPTGITYISTIDEIWVVDSNDDNIYRYSTAGAFLGSYNLDSGNDSPQGITYISTIDEIWVVDADDNIYRYSTAGAFLGSYNLDSGNDTPRGITHISTIDEVWVVDTDDNIYRYSTAGAFLGSYNLDSGNTLPTGITYISTIDEVWVVDADDNIYRYHIYLAVDSDGLVAAITQLSEEGRNSARAGLGLQGRHLTVTAYNNRDAPISGEIIVAYNGSSFTVAKGSYDPPSSTDLFVINYG